MNVFCWLNMLAGRQFLLVDAVWHVCLLEIDQLLVAFQKPANFGTVQELTGSIPEGSRIKAGFLHLLGTHRFPLGLSKKAGRMTWHHSSQAARLAATGILLPRWLFCYIFMQQTSHGIRVKACQSFKGFGLSWDEPTLSNTLTALSSRSFCLFAGVNSKAFDPSPDRNPFVHD